MSKGLIIVSYQHPPIPDRRWDYCAYHEEDVECGWKYGWGKTDREAVEHLHRLDQMAQKN